MPVEVEVIGADQFRDLGRALRHIDPALAKEMRKVLRTEVTKPVLDAVRSAARAGNGHLGADSAMSVRQVVRDTGRDAGVRLELSKGRMGARVPGANSGELGGHLDQGGWRHPVYGRRTVWVAQRSTIPGWFTATTERESPAAMERLDQALGRFLDSAWGRL